MAQPHTHQADQAVIKDQAGQLLTQMEWRLLRDQEVMYGGVLTLMVVNKSGQNMQHFNQAGFKKQFKPMEITQKKEQIIMGEHGFVSLTILDGMRTIKA
jgi:hypothetical protein